ncbi:MAG: hypothetical protein QOF26_3236, partial [Baekduia sp.]|nr:hypothetical protein [Baekduia sp.]
MARPAPVPGPFQPAAPAVSTVRDERVLSGVQRVQHAALGALWVFVVVSFWRW